ncbi:Carboxymethyl transferase [Ceraceosorus bombacis]|uniref:Leucine carboxyl methyltransferase 1 n=1 Tax=Ceraceosorus bombacis TaxID=401625 RepID=A0A0P1BPA5_9BASI|nr:Carboxymethyl transferase [Ceraceosorus bombacis]
MASLSLGEPRRRGGANNSSNSSNAASASTSSSTQPGTRSSLFADESIRSTDSDALISRLSALQAGYLPAERKGSSERSSFSHYLLPMGTPLPLPKRPPIINIGTALRCLTIDQHVERFLLKGDQMKQIISLGAGSDARYFRILADEALSARLAHYVELDFSQLTRAKVERIARADPLRKSLQGMRVEANGTALRSASYAILPGDLRELADPSKSAALQHTLWSILHPSLPTLILAECVLSYLPAQDSTSLLTFLSRRFSNISALSYDMCISGSDRLGEAPKPSKFGSVMLSNLAARGLTLEGAKECTTPLAYAEKFALAFGADAATSEDSKVVDSGCTNLRQVWAEMNAEERSRWSRLEGLDEVEELEILLEHYGVSWATRERGADPLETDEGQPVS